MGALFLLAMSQGHFYLLGFSSGSLGPIFSISLALMAQPRGGAVLLISVVSATLVPLPSMIYKGNSPGAMEKNPLQIHQLWKHSNLILREQVFSCLCCLVSDRDSCYTTGLLVLAYPRRDVPSG